MSYRVVIFVSILFVVFSCNKESVQPASNGGGNGQLYPNFTVNDFPHHIGDTCYYYITKTETTEYFSGGFPPTTYTTSGNFYSTIVTDSVLPNGVVGKLWHINGFPLTGAAKRLVYYDSTLQAYVFIPILFYAYDSEQAMILKMPLLQNSSWVNTINNTNDTCKTSAVNLFPYNGSQQIGIQLNRELNYNGSSPSTTKFYKYTIGDKGFLQIDYTNVDILGNFATTTEFKTKLTKTNF